MRDCGHDIFGSRADRGYDREAVETFPWPVTACYNDVHRWMDEGLEVHAAWQVRDAWEALVKFLSTLAVADFLQASDDVKQKSVLLSILLRPQGLSLGHWRQLMEFCLKDSPRDGVTFGELRELLFHRGRPTPLMRTIDGDQNCFIFWRNRRFGHGVFQKQASIYAEEAKYWLERLHDAYDACRQLLQSIMLQSLAPNGELLTWNSQLPLPFYHQHCEKLEHAAILSVSVVRRTVGHKPLELTPLLSVQRCAVCGQWQAFYFDKYEPKKHRIWFLDFVEGHSHNRDDLERVRAWARQVREVDARQSEAESVELCEPDPELFRDFAHEFEPPIYLARELADFINTHDRGVIQLIGSAGVGKSWVTQGLDHAKMLPDVLGRAICALNVSLHGATPPNSIAVKSQLDEQAKRRKHWQVPPEADGPTADGRFAAWLAALMRANDVGELLITVDGLDELPADSDVPAMFSSGDKLPRGCYVVFANRPHVQQAVRTLLERVRAADTHYLALRIDADNRAHREILQSYVTKRLARRRPDDLPTLPSEWADPLIDLAGGSFLYTYHFCRALHFGIYETLDDLPAPADYYPRFFAHLEARVGSELFEKYYARTLALIAAAREPIGMSHLVVWGLERMRLIVVLHDIAELLSKRREPWDSESVYTLGHDALREFFQKDSRWQAYRQAASRDLAQLAHERFSRCQWKVQNPVDTEALYLLRFVLTHARESALHDVESEVLSSTEYAKECTDLGISFGVGGWHRLALQCFEPAIEVGRHQWHQTHDSRLGRELANMLRQQAKALLELGSTNSALDNLRQGLDVLDQIIDDPPSQYLRAQVLSAQGAVLATMARWDESIQCLQDSNAILDNDQVMNWMESEGEGSRWQLIRESADLARQLGNIFLDLGNAVKAEEYFDKSIRILRVPPEDK